MESTDTQMLDSYLSLLSKLYGIDFNTVSSKLPFLIQQLWHITIAWQCYLKGDKKLVSVVISNTCQSQHVFAFHFSCLLINLESAEQEERIYPPILASTKSLFVKCNFGNTADRWQVQSKSKQSWRVFDQTKQLANYRCCQEHEHLLWLFKMK